jgi:hypothetical protein
MSKSTSEGPCEQRDDYQMPEELFLKCTFSRVVAGVEWWSEPKVDLVKTKSDMEEPQLMSSSGPRMLTNCA